MDYRAGWMLWLLVTELKRIILTPEKGIRREERWEEETPFTVKQISERLQPN